MNRKRAKDCRSSKNKHRDSKKGKRKENERKETENVSEPSSPDIFERSSCWELVASDKFGCIE